MTAARDAIKGPAARCAGYPHGALTLYALDRTQVVASLELPPPIPKHVAHDGMFFTRGHRLPSGWAFEQVR